MAKKFKFYDVRKTMKAYPDCQYYVIYGERSNGKTYSALDYALEQYGKTGKQFGYVRRMSEDIRPKNLSALFASHIENDRISKWTNGEWTHIVYGSKKFFLARYNEEGEMEKREEPIGFAFDLSGMEHSKSLSYPNITTIIFDEFLSRVGYLPNEFLLFQNVLSTIIRLRTDVTVFMLGNTVSKYCPYFSEMGLTHIKDQEQDTVEIYNYGTSGLKVAVEYTASSKSSGGKPSDVYFAFDNPQLQMITTGAWEFALYPKLANSYRPKDVICQFFIDFDKELLHGEIICKDSGVFAFLHPKTSNIKSPDEDIVYTDYSLEKYNYKTCLTRQTDKLSRLIIQLTREGKVFYATNETGEVYRAYLKWCNQYAITN